MKNVIVFLTLWLAVSIAASAQNSTQNPPCGMNTVHGLTIERIDRSDTATVLHFRYTARAGVTIMIPDKSYIQPLGGEKLFVVRTEGISMSKWVNVSESGFLAYQLVFPKLEGSVSTIDYGEANDGGDWFIYDIVNYPKAATSVVPEQFMGNWFVKENGSLLVGLYHNSAVYNGQLWQYGPVHINKNKGTVRLLNGTQSLDLELKYGKNEECLIGEKQGHAQLCCLSSDQATFKKPLVDPAYQAPVFRLDTAIFSGFIKGFTLRAGIKTLRVIVDDIIVGYQNSYTATIAENGTFSVKLPLYSPQLAYIRSDIYNGSVFLEPGREVFQVLGAGSEPLFMGPLAKINADMARLNKIEHFDYYRMMDTIVDMSLNDYKAYCQNIAKADSEALDSVMRSNAIGPKAYQIKKLDILYGSAGNMMEYVWNFESAYRKRHHIRDRKTALPVNIEKPTADYYDFITDSMANNPLAVLSSRYNTFVNRIKYLDVLMTKIKHYTSLDVVDELQKSGYVFTAHEKKLIEGMKVAEDTVAVKQAALFNEKYGERMSELANKHRKDLEAVIKQAKDSGKPQPSIGQSLQQLADCGTPFTDDEKEVVGMWLVHEKSNNPMQHFYEQHKDSIDQFHARHRIFLNGLYARARKDAYSSNLSNLLGVQSGLITELMTAQDDCRGIVEEMMPVAENELTQLISRYSIPFLGEYLRECNTRTLAKLEANKHKTGYVVNQVPQTEGDKLFDAIIEKYRGKVVYVDFWATWCAPCRSGIERIKPLKDEMAGQDVVFVYITNNSSPLGTWGNMITDIKGEHYRVSSDEWNYLSSKFNITGIPHYVLVGKKGEVINPQLGHMENGSIKRELNKYMEM